MQVARQVFRYAKVPIAMVLLLGFLGLGAAWGLANATATIPPRPVPPCVPIDVGGKLTSDLVQVRVLNGGTRGNLAKSTALILRTNHFKVIKVNNSDERIDQTIIVGNSVNDPEVKMLVDFFPGATAKGDGRVDHVVDVLLGSHSEVDRNRKAKDIDVAGPVCLPADTKLPTSTPSPSPTK